MSEQVLTSQVLLNLLQEYKRPYDKIEELVRSGILDQLRRGYYVAGKAVRTAKPELFTIANHLYGPSYVSGPSALSYWGMIPERVYGVSSATSGKAKMISLPTASLEYYHLPIDYYTVGIRLVNLSEAQNILLASPEKSLCDTVIFTKGLNLRSIRQTRYFLLEDLRIDIENLQSLEIQKIEGWLDISPKRASMDKLYKTICSI